MSLRHARDGPEYLHCVERVETDARLVSLPYLRRAVSALEARTAALAHPVAAPGGPVEQAVVDARQRLLNVCQEQMIFGQIVSLHFIYIYIYIYIYLYLYIYMHKSTALEPNFLS